MRRIVAIGIRPNPPVPLPSINPPTLALTTQTQTTVTMQATYDGQGVAASQYVFQSSPALGGPFTTVSTQSSTSFSTSAPAANVSVYYRVAVIVTDGRQTVWSSILSITGSAVTTSRVWVPGHWMDTAGGSIQAAGIVAGISGVVVRKPWNSLEPTDFNYSFGAIGNLLDQCAGYRIYMYVMIEQKSFQKTLNYAPPRLVPYTNVYTASTDPTKGGIVMWRAHTVVNTAYGLLIQAIGNYVAGHPNKAWFAGIATQETASQAQVTDPTYTADNYITALCNESDFITNYCTTGRGFHYVNQIAGNGNGNKLPIYSTRVRENGGVWGFPDLVMGNAGINNNVYPWVLAMHNSGGATFASIQNAEYQPISPAKGSSAYTTAHPLETLYQYGTGNTAFPDDFGDNQNHADILVWTYRQVGSDQVHYNPDAINVIQAHPAPFGTVTPLP